CGDVSFVAGGAVVFWGGDCACCARVGIKRTNVRKKVTKALLLIYQSRPIRPPRAHGHEDFPRGAGFRWATVDSEQAPKTERGVEILGPSGSSCMAELDHLSLSCSILFGRWFALSLSHYFIHFSLVVIY